MRKSYAGCNDPAKILPTGRAAATRSVMAKGWQGKAKPKRVAGGRSWSGVLLVPGLVVLLLLGSLLVLALLMTRAPAAAAPAGSAAASSRMQPAADGKCEDRNEMCAATPYP